MTFCIEARIAITLFCELRVGDIHTGMRRLRIQTGVLSGVCKLKVDPLVRGNVTDGIIDDPGDALLATEGLIGSLCRRCHRCG